MKFYVVEVPTPYQQVPFRRFLERSKSALNERLLNILQRDAFGGNPLERTGKPSVFTIDIPTPVTQSTVESLIKGEIYQYVVDQNGEADPKPNPWKPDNRQTLAQMLSVAEAQEVEDFKRQNQLGHPAEMTPVADPDEDAVAEAVTEAELEEQGQEPLPF